MTDEPEISTSAASDRSAGHRAERTLLSMALCASCVLHAAVVYGVVHLRNSVESMRGQSGNPEARILYASIVAATGDSTTHEGAPKEDLNAAESISDAPPPPLPPVEPPVQIVKIKSKAQPAETKKPLVSRTAPAVRTEGGSSAVIRGQRISNQSDGGLSGGTSSSGPEIIEAKVAKFVEPEYPRFARQKRLEGTVILRVSLDEHGKITNVEIGSSSGYSILDKAAQEALNSATFEAARKDGVPVPALKVMKYNFRLSSG